jgi:hypothetical protein
MGPTLSLVGAQVALSVVLCFGAVLFFRSINEALSIDVGFLREGLASVTVRTDGRDPNAVQAIDMFSQRVGGVPGVAAVAIGPMPFVQSSDMVISEVEVDGEAVELAVPLEIAYVDAEYFSTLSQPIIRGRGFDETTASGPVVGVLNEAAAGLFWPDEDAIGKHFTWPPRTVITVTGVAGNAKLRSLRESGRPALYLDRTQQRARVSGAISANQSASIVLRTSPKPSVIS